MQTAVSCSKKLITGVKDTQMDVIRSFFSPFLIGQNLPPNEHQHSDAWKYANHNNIAIEPQFILCYEDFKDHHLPDIHNKGINRKEKCKDSNEEIKIKNIWLGENLDTCFLYCMFFFVLFFYKMVFDCNVLLVFF